MSDRVAQQLRDAPDAGGHIGEFIAGKTFKGRGVVRESLARHRVSDEDGHPIGTPAALVAARSTLSGERLVAYDVI